MREVFAPKDTPPTDPGEVFYTIRAEDVGKSPLQTEIGPIGISAVLGRVLKSDVGKRLYRVRVNDDPRWTEYVWQAESNAQFERRVNRDGKN